MVLKAPMMVADSSIHNHFRNQDVLRQQSTDRNPKTVATFLERRVLTQTHEHLNIGSLASPLPDANNARCAVPAYCRAQHGGVMLTCEPLVVHMLPPACGCSTDCNATSRLLYTNDTKCTAGVHKYKATRTCGPLAVHVFCFVSKPCLEP